MWLDELLYGPAEAAGSVLVDGFEEEEDAADFEDRGADEGCDAAAYETLVGECCRWAHEREEGEEGVDHPDYRAPGEDVGYPPGDVPDGVEVEHEEDVVHDGAPTGRWKRVVITGVANRVLVGLDHKGMSSFAVIARSPFVLDI